MARRRSHAYDVSAPLLAVYMYGKRVGTLGQSGSDIWFKYDDWTLDAADPRTWQLSVRLPVQSEPYGHEPSLVFFDNLLLESDTRRELAAATKFDSSDTTGLLGKVGAECAGAVSVWPIQTQPPSVPEYRAIGNSELECLFSERHGERLTQLQIESRQTMSGVQQKLVFARFDTTYHLPLDGAPGSVILKRTSGRYDQLALNEHACMRLLEAAGLPVAGTSVLGDASGLLVSERFDRIVRDDRTIERLHQEDFCQATGRRPAAKYQQHNGGASLADLARVLRVHATAPAEDIGVLVRAAIANVCVGNMDAHAKNFALLTVDGVTRLAPLYDVVCTEVYESLDRELSMNFGHACNPATISYSDVTRLAKDLGVSAALITDEIERTTVFLLEHRHEIFHRVATDFGDGSVLAKIDAVVEKRCQRLRAAAVRT